MRRCLLDDPLEVLWVNVSVVVLVKVKERLSHTLSLETAQHLCELRVCHRMPMPFAAQIQLRPVAVPVEGNCVARLVARIALLEAAEVHLAGGGVCEEAEGDVVFGIGFCQEIVEDAPVLDGNASIVVAIGDAEQ